MAMNSALLMKLVCIGYVLQVKLPQNSINAMLKPLLYIYIKANIDTTKSMNSNSENCCDFKMVGGVEYIKVSTEFSCCVLMLRTFCVLILFIWIV